jgi:hypothetical protein
MAELIVLCDEIVDPCECRWLLWSVRKPDGWELHVHPLCPACEAAFKEIISKHYPGVPITVTDDAANK